ncbi:MAG TPA: MOSC domain-containing protein [Pseudonocardia sp.]|nr:MOSC domain-containing protein [Pseudonocardia sp.]
MTLAEGRVVSVNVAVVRTDPWTRVKSGRSGIDKRPVDGPVALLSYGVDGDTICDTEHHGGPDQAVYAYGCEDLAFWSAELGQPVTPGGVGENLTLVGVDCSGAVVGERWHVGGDAVLRVRGPRIPCRVFAGFRGVPDLIKRFVTAGRPGCYLSVERTGRVRAGDPVRVLDRPAHGVTVTDVMAAMIVDRERARLVAAARDDLGERGRDWLDRTLFNLARIGPRAPGAASS